MAKALIKEVLYEFNTRTVFIYKKEFGVDLIADMSSITDVNVDISIFLQVIFCLQKTGNRNLDFETFQEETDMSSIMQETFFKKVMGLIEGELKGMKPKKSATRGK